MVTFHKKTYFGGKVISSAFKLSPRSIANVFFFETHQHKLVPHLRNENPILMLTLMELTDIYFGLKSLCKDAMNSMGSCRSL